MKDDSALVLYHLLQEQILVALAERNAVRAEIERLRTEVACRNKRFLGYYRDSEIKVRVKR